jgi:O-antigen/teichoic acid export membrane protein
MNDIHDSTGGTRSLIGNLLGGAAIAGGLRVAGAGLTFLFFLLLARNTNPEAFGAFSTVYSIATILGYVANAGQHVAILKVSPATHANHGAGAERDVVSRGLAVVLLSSSLLLGAIMLVSSQTSWLPEINTDSSRNVWVLSAQLMVALAIAEYCASVLRARSRIVFALAPRDIAWRIIAMVLIAYFASNSWPIDATIATTLTTLALTLAIAPQLLTLVVDLVRSIRSGGLLETCSGAYFREVGQFWISTSIKPIVDYAATIVVAFALGPAAAAAYFAADRLAKLLAMALISIEQISAPLLAKSYHGDDLGRAQTIASATSAMATLVTLAGLAVYGLLGTQLLGLFGQEYTSAYPVLLVLAAAQLANTYAGSNVVTLLMTGGQNHLTAIWAIWGATGASASFFAAASFGVLGAAVSTLVVTGVDPISPDSWRLGLGTEAQELAW